MMPGLNLDAWWDEPAYKPCNTLRLRGLFIFRKLREHDPAKFQDVMTDLYRDDQPDDPQDWPLRVADDSRLHGREARTRLYGTTMDISGLGDDATWDEPPR